MMRNQADSGLDAEKPGLDSAVVAEQIRLLLHKRSDVPVNLLNAAIVGVAFRHIYPGWVVSLWLGLFCIIILARVLIRRRSLLTSFDRSTVQRWGRIFALNALATGCMWGLTGSVILLTPDPVFHVFIVFVLGGMMAGGIVSNAAYTPAMYGFMLPTIIPVIAALFYLGDITHAEMGVMLAVFALVLIVTGRNINRSIIENFRLRITQDLLLDKLRVSEAVMAEAQEIAQFGSWEIDLLTNTYVASDETYHIFGVDLAHARPSYDEMMARIHADDRDAVDKDMARTIAVGSSNGIDHRLVMDDGSIKHVHELGRVTYAKDGRPLRMIGTVQDVTESRIAEDNLKFANILLKTEMEASPDGILVVDANRKVLLSNHRFTDIWKTPESTLTIGSDEGVLAAGTALVKDPEKFFALVEEIYAQPSASSHDEFEMLDGRFIERHTVPLTTAAGDSLGRIWFFRDITEAKVVAARALRLARFDGLTGLANRSVFVEALQHEVARAKRGERGFAVIYLDLDHFKDVNDTLGHPVGDALLQAVADRLRLNTRESDTVARFGGDEFAVIVANIAEPADAGILAETLIEALGQVYSIQGNDIYSGASIGIDIYGPDAPDAEALLSHADVALYRAKKEGRDGYKFFTDAMDTEVRTQVSLGTELHHALEYGQLFIMYQPQVAIGSSQITGVEALVRWHHPIRGIVGPDLFIPVAEKTGFIVKLGRWVLLTACRQAKAWFDDGIKPVRLAVNLSGVQFKSPIALETDIAKILEETGLPPDLLELELTETVLMNASLEQSDIVSRLRRIGVTIAIDDFGTGYSSLDYLRRFPVDRMKIAQNFVRHLKANSGEASIVKATIDLAHALDIMVVAEGVETEEQLELLKEWGCGEVQGFYFSKPLTAEETARLLRKGGMLPPPVNH